MIKLSGLREQNAREYWCMGGIVECFLPTSDVSLRSIVITCLAFQPNFFLSSSGSYLIVELRRRNWEPLYLRLFLGLNCPQEAALLFHFTRVGEGLSPYRITETKRETAKFWIQC